MFYVIFFHQIIDEINIMKNYPHPHAPACSRQANGALPLSLEERGVTK